MKKQVLFFCYSALFCIFALNSYAQDLSSKQLADILPAKIYNLSQKLSTKSEVEKVLGKPSLIENQKSYYQIGKLKYDLVITYKDENLKEIFYTFSGKRPDLKSLGIIIDEKKLRPYLVNKQPAHLSLITNNSQEMVINLAEWTIYSLRILK